MSVIGDVRNDFVLRDHVPTIEMVGAHRSIVTTHARNAGQAWVRRATAVDYEVTLAGFRLAPLDAPRFAGLDVRVYHSLEYLMWSSPAQENGIVELADIKA